MDKFTESPRLERSWMDVFTNNNLMSSKTMSVLQMNKTVLYWICQIGGWSAYGMSTLFASGALKWNTAADVCFTMVCLLGLSHLYRNFIVRKGWLKLLFVKLFLRIIIASVTLAILAIPFSLLSYFLFDPEKISTDFTQEGIFMHILGGTFVFFCWSLAYFLYHYVTSYNRNLKWEAMINEFELNKLRSQLNPHFIFNALNTVRALVDEDPNKAKDSIQQLSNILRNSLLMDKKKVISFGAELDIVKDYLALESTRFEERLKVEIDVDKEALSYKVPPLMIQTLVENGIKHGISKLKNGGVIHLTAKVENDHLLCDITNSGHYKPSEDRKQGYGIKSTLQRLELLYHQEASFQIYNDNTAETPQVMVELKIPKWDESQLVTSVS